MRFLHRRHWRAAYAGRIADSGLARIRASRYDQAPGSELGRGNLNRRPSTGIAVMVANVAMRTSRVVIVGAGFGGLSAARSLAIEAEQQAKRACDLDAKEGMLEIARQWRELAEQHEPREL